jgi:hypothetical protein
VLVLIFLLVIFDRDFFGSKRQTQNIEFRTERSAFCVGCSTFDVCCRIFSRSRWRPTDVGCDDRVLDELDTTG